jgi:amidophosphoribosyltransferase
MNSKKIFSKLKEECGVVGVFGHNDTSRLIHLGLFALQHRGQEACGIVTFEDVLDADGEESPKLKTSLHVHKAFGLVGDSVTESVIQRLKGRTGVGHVRYSTHGGALVENIQPFQFKTVFGPVAIAHNGNLTNAREIRKDLEASGSVFQSTSDTEVFVHLIARSDRKTLRDRISDALTKVKGAFSLVIMTNQSLFAARDPHGFRPLSLGKLGDAWVVASETCALSLMGASFVRELAAGEVMEMTEQSVESWAPHQKQPETFCSFEPIYFSRPDSLLHGQNIYSYRRRIGEILAKECPADVDFVMAIPDSGVAMAEGYASAAALPLQMGLVRNHYIGRTFIEPTQTTRDFGVRLKLSALESVLKGKRIVVIDDSLVRGTTSARIFRMLREAGTSEIHFRIGAPPITHSCFYGVDTPQRRDLLAAQMTVEEIRLMLGADSIGFISVSGLKQALSTTSTSSNCGFCFACFTGKYPTDVQQAIPEMPTDRLGPGLFASR